jgi:NAD(P)H dehydrogenase (quinone)
MVTRLKQIAHTDACPAECRHGSRRSRPGTTHRAELSRSLPDEQLNRFRRGGTSRCRGLSNLPSTFGRCPALWWLPEIAAMTKLEPLQKYPLHVVIACHPKADSFNLAVARRYCETVEGYRHRTELRDLYRLGFNPVLSPDELSLGEIASPPADVATELDFIDRADVIVLVYPIWLGAPPAMLKGYIDRVFAASTRYDGFRQHENAQSRERGHLVSFSSSGSAKQWLDEQGAWLSLKNLFDTYLRHALLFSSTKHIHFGSIVEGLNPRFVGEHLLEVEQAARRIASEIHPRGIIKK